MRLSFKKIFSPFWQLVAYLVLLPILELFLLIKFLGLWLTLLSVLISGLIGVTLAYRECWRIWGELNRQLDHGESSTQPFLHGVLVMMGALFMIVPGLLTSLFGLLLIFPLTRSFVVSYLVLHFEAYRFQKQRGNASSSPEIIDV